MPMKFDRTLAGQMVRVEGLEPPKLSPPEPKSGVSTSSTTPASGAELPIAFARALYNTAFDGVKGFLPAKTAAKAAFDQLLLT
jgi:hypothetical protein